MSRQKQSTADADRIDARIAQWQQALPALDTSGMAILGRMRWITLRARPAIDAVFAEHGIDAGEFDVLATLRRAGAACSLTPTQLYRSLMVSSGGMTARLAKLEARGLIARANGQDGRSLPVSLTPAGKRLVECAVRDDMAVESALLQGLSKTEQTALAALLRKLIVSIDDAADSP